ncbi:MAG: hypothetical protein QM708_07290 [Propioniciclava sp.]|uniref:hypothetical protein n=1 Tax=Propioniciclava sp. TaxID=2038686 RepID=UPI0039E5C284
MSLAGTALVVLYAAFAAVQILVLNPLAAVPGQSLDQIHAGLAAQGETLAPPLVLITLGIGVALALAVLVRSWRHHDTDPWSAILSYSALLTLGAPAYFVASFGPGMALADAYGISGADYSPWAAPLYVISLITLVSTVVAMNVLAGKRRASGTAITA